MGDYRKEQDLIFQEIDEKRILLEQVEKKGREDLEWLVSSLMDHRRRINKPLTEDEARARVKRFIEED